MLKLENTIIFCHGDCDGITSGAITLAANPGAKIWLTNPINLDNDLRKNSNEYSRVIITDIALNDKSLKDTYKEMQEMRKKGVEIAPHCDLR